MHTTFHQLLGPSALSSKQMETAVYFELVRSSIEVLDAKPEWVIDHHDVYMYQSALIKSVLILLILYSRVGVVGKHRRMGLPSCVAQMPSVDCPSIHHVQISVSK